MPKVSNVKSPLPVLDTPLHEPKEVQNSEAFSAAGSNEELGVSFDQPMQADTLHNANKVTLVFRIRGRGIKNTVCPRAGVCFGMQVLLAVWFI